MLINYIRMDFKIIRGATSLCLLCSGYFFYSLILCVERFEKRYNDKLNTLKKEILDINTKYNKLLVMFEQINTEKNENNESSNSNLETDNTKIICPIDLSCNEPSDDYLVQLCNDALEEYALDVKQPPNLREQARHIRTLTTKMCWQDCLKDWCFCKITEIALQRWEYLKFPNMTISVIGDIRSNLQQIRNALETETIVPKIDIDLINSLYDKNTVKNVEVKNVEEPDFEIVEQNCIDDKCRSGNRNRNRGTSISEIDWKKATKKFIFG